MIRIAPNQNPVPVGFDPEQSRLTYTTCVAGVLIRFRAAGFWPVRTREKCEKIGLSAICGERKQTPRFDVSRWNYGVVIESMKGRPLLGVQEVPSSNPGGPTS